MPTRNHAPTRKGVEQGEHGPLLLFNVGEAVAELSPLLHQGGPPPVAGGDPAGQALEFGDVVVAEGSGGVVLEPVQDDETGVVVQVFFEEAQPADAVVVGLLLVQEVLCGSGQVQGCPGGEQPVVRAATPLRQGGVDGVLGRGEVGGWQMGCRIERCGVDVGADGFFGAGQQAGPAAGGGAQGERSWPSHAASPGGGKTGRSRTSTRWW
ncbi:hypothetical protein [Streptomyces sp. NPDC055109]